MILDEAPALWASSASIASASRSSLSVGLWRKIAASETQRTAVLRASKAVNWARRGFEVGTKRATKKILLKRPASVPVVVFGAEQTNSLGPQFPHLGFDALQSRRDLIFGLDRELSHEYPEAESSHRWRSMISMGSVVATRLSPSRTAGETSSARTIDFP